VLGFAPLAALPLAAGHPALIVAVGEQLSATGAITFGGSASAGAKTPMTATGTITFAGSGFLLTEVYRSATGSITFAGSPMLRVAGKQLPGPRRWGGLHGHGADADLRFQGCPMSATNATETAILSLIFTATAWADIAQNDGSSPATTFYISLHTATPGETGDQTSNETAYTGYARVSVSRDASGWTVTGNSVTNDAEIAFGQCTADWARHRAGPARCCCSTRSMPA
jgi:hypothetical protein